MITEKIAYKKPFKKNIIPDLKEYNMKGHLIEEYDTVPNGHLTGEQFEKCCIETITKFYREKSLL